MIASATRALTVGGLAAVLVLASLDPLDSGAAIDAAARAWRDDTLRWLGESRAAPALRAAGEMRQLLAGLSSRMPGVSVALRAGSSSAVELGVLRAASLWAWMPLVAPLWIAALADGALARYADASRARSRPERAAMAARGLQGLLAAALPALAWPGDYPVLLVPAVGVGVAVLLRAWARHRPGELG